ncbi:hypothetical protein NQZ79_g774 [Umbelopsis isabellina]|nr:hypothetical protein NQZ79_g774 [Umbelopsis isabellina]
METNEDTQVQDADSIMHENMMPVAASSGVSTSDGSASALAPQDGKQAISQMEQKALQENEDYQAIKKALTILRYQLEKARKDVKVLVKMKEEAIAEPIEFVNRLKRKEVSYVHANAYPTTFTAKLEAVASSSNSFDRKTVFKNILEMPMPSVRDRETKDTSHAKITAELDRAANAMENVGSNYATATPSRATSVSEMSDKESDDESMANTKSGKGRGKRRASAVGLFSRHLQDPPSPTSSTTSNHVSAEEITPRSLLQKSSWLSDSSQYDSPSRHRTLSPELSHKSRDNGDDENKPVTHNLPWSDEEQKRLEELLVIYPDEPVQAQRFNKIAAALGTRTARQVGSRVQKYFIKLAKNGLPVPGRITIPVSRLFERAFAGLCVGRLKCVCASRQVYLKRSDRIKRPNPILKKPNPKARAESDTTVRRTGTSYNVHLPGSTSSVRVSGARYITENPSPSVMMADNDLDSSLMMVGSGAFSSASQKPAVNEHGEAIHYGFACDSCGDEPIVGARYKCTQCDISEEVDLCEKCYEEGTFTNDHHPLSHQFEAISTADPLPYYADDDYAGDSHLGEFDYLG